MKIIYKTDDGREWTNQEQAMAWERFNREIDNFIKEKDSTMEFSGDTAAALRRLFRYHHGDIVHLLTMEKWPHIEGVD